MAAYDELVSRIYTTAPIELDFDDTMEVNSYVGKFVKTGHRVRLVECLGWKRKSQVTAYLTGGYVAIGNDDYARAREHGIIERTKRWDGVEPLAPPNPNVPYYREEK
jgi:hypothetical protein